MSYVDALETELRFAQETGREDRARDIRKELARAKGADEAPVEKAVAPRSARVSKPKAED